MKENDSIIPAKHPRHSLGYLIFQWLRQAYDELGLILLLDLYLLAVFMLSFAPAGLFAWLEEQSLLAFDEWNVVQMMLFLLGMWLSLNGWLALNHHFSQILTFQYPSWSLFWSSYLSFMKKSFFCTLVLGGGAGILIFDALVFPRMFPGQPLVSLTAVALAFWLLLFLGMVQVHLVPFLACQERPFGVAVKRAVTVALWKPVRTLFILLIQGAFILSCLRLPPLIFILPGAYAILSVLSLLILLDEWRDPYEKTPEAVRAGA